MNLAKPEFPSNENSVTLLWFSWDNDIGSHLDLFWWYWRISTSVLWFSWEIAVGPQSDPFWQYWLVSKFSYDFHGKSTFNRTCTHFGDSPSFQNCPMIFKGYCCWSSLRPILVILASFHICPKILMRCSPWVALGPILAILASLHNFLVIFMGYWH